MNPISMRNCSRGIRTTSERKSTRSSALIIALAMVVLVTAMVVAFLSSATLARQVSKSSNTQTRMDILAKAGLVMTVGDLRQEIVDGSTVVVVSSATNYVPNSSANMVPYRNEPNAAALPNVLKISARTTPFYPSSGYNAAGVTRACAAATTTPCQNSRSISMDDWNKALLLPKATTTQATNLAPVASFTAPDWINIARDGSNPNTPTTSVVGRYAYVVYDEGGLLDVNAAGYPSILSTQSPAVVAHKTGLGTADLSTVFAQVGFTTAQSTALSDTLVGWRNYSTAQSTGAFPTYSFIATSGTNYYNSLISNPTGFLTVNSGLSGGQSDRKFASRQQLIQFLQQGMATSTTSRYELQNALQYLGTFSRGLEQPSFIPNASRPLIATASDTYTAPLSSYKYDSNAGGNNAYELDIQINPSFLSIRATTAFTRNDGSMAVIGEPLVKKRFLLNRLCWLTYKGPSSSLADTDSIVTGLVAQGVPLSLIHGGTAANILSYFGLTWSAATSSWTYDHGVTGKIGRLSDVQGLGRDADFFELLKAGMVAGSLGKASASSSGWFNASLTAGDINQYKMDTNVDAQIIQIGANIIDAYKADTYPIDIYFTAASQDFYGAENLPYLYRASCIGINVNGATAISPATPAPVPGTVGIMLLLPQVWNPYDPNSPSPSSASPIPGPTNFRFFLVAGAGTPGGTVQAYGKTRVMALSAVAGNGDWMETEITSATGSLITANASPVTIDTAIPTGNANGVTEIDFSVTSTNGCANPVFLGNVEPTGTFTSVSQIAPGTGFSITIPSSNNLKTPPSGYSTYLSTVDGNGFAKDAVTGESYCGVLLGGFPVSWTYSGATPPYSFPPAQVPPYVQDPETNAASLPVPPWHMPVPNEYPGDNPSTADECTTAQQYDANYVLQYQDYAGNWRTYDNKYALIPVEGQTSVSKWTYGEKNSYNVDITGTLPNETGLANYYSLYDLVNLDWVAWMDPRTSRFGAIFGVTLSGSGGTPTTSSPPGNCPIGSANWYLHTMRPGTDIGTGTVYSVPGTGIDSNSHYPQGDKAPSIGWYPGSWPEGTAGYFFPGFYADNVTGNRTASPNGPGNANYFTDPDGVVRRGMSGAVVSTPSSTTGLPLADLTSVATQTQSRPYLLHRPFTSVAELGYVFSGTPWRNLDFLNPESGGAPLLDLFCVSDTNDPNALTAGKVNLNTRQPLVIQAILAGTGGTGYAYKDELNAGIANTGPTTQTDSLSKTEAKNIGAALVAYTTATPLANVSELVGTWSSKVTVSGGAVSATAPNIDGSQSYVGPALSSLIPQLDTTSATIERFAESVLRPLAAAGQTRVWNVMIDLVAQTGHYLPGETSLDNFVVDGQKRYWLHVAIDRYTGQILDEQLEPVRE